MVSGHTQTIDSVSVKANVSMDSLELKVPEEDLATYLARIRNIIKQAVKYLKKKISLVQQRKPLALQQVIY